MSGNESRRPVNAGRRHQNLFRPSFTGNDDFLPRLVRRPSAVVHTAKARRSAFCRFWPFGLRFECIGTTANFFSFHGHERPVVAASVLIRHAFRHAMQ